MSSSTPQQHVFYVDEGLHVSRVPSATLTVSSASEAQTRSGQKLISRFGAYVLPLATAAAIAAPVPPNLCRRVFSRAVQSSSGTMEIPSVSTDWAFTESRITAQEIADLNALLSLPMTEGFRLDSPDA